MGHHVLELSREEQGLKVVNQLHHYYQGYCSCSHRTKSKPGVGIVSQVVGRTRNLKITEYVLVGANLASLIASLGVRYRLSRAKIQEFLTSPSGKAGGVLGAGGVRCLVIGESQ